MLRHWTKEQWFLMKYINEQQWLKCPYIIVTEADIICQTEKCIRIYIIRVITFMNLEFVFFNAQTWKRLEHVKMLKYNLSCKQTTITPDRTRLALEKRRNVCQKQRIPLIKCRLLQYKSDLASWITLLASGEKQVCKGCYSSHKLIMSCSAFIFL